MATDLTTRTDEDPKTCGTPEQCPACTAELLHPEPICQDCGAATDGPDARRGPAVDRR